jgi:hypothetical protein
VVTESFLFVLGDTMRKLYLVTAAASLAGVAAPASAALTLFQSYTGQYGLSTDGGGSVTGPYTVSAFVPVGATVTAAYLYQGMNNVSSVRGLTFNGNALTFDTFVPNGTACCSLASARADVTSIVASVINGGAGGTYNFNVTEASTFNTDGVALVVVYTAATLAEATVAILDGFASVTGDTTTLNFATPLDPTAPGFIADMRLGINFSCCDQRSTVRVNGTLMTENAGNNDDGVGSISDGQLITVGGDDDPFSPANPTYATDRERYNLTPFITAGDTSITIQTANASRDDNIFLLAGRFSGIAGVNQPPPTGAVPEPSTWAMLILGFGAVGATMRRRRQTTRLAFG